MVCYTGRMPVQRVPARGLQEPRESKGMTTNHLRNYLLIAVLAIAPPGAGAATYYLRADAAAGGGGTNWITAFNRLETAIAACASGDTICAAEGIYIVSNAMTVATGVTIKGGYSADGTERDPATRQTIFTGDLGLNDLWAHVTPQHGQYALQTTTLTATVLQNGKFVPPPAYTGDYDAYIAVKPSGDANTQGGFNFTSTDPVTLDGLWFTGFEGVAVNLGSVAGVRSVTNCHFVACVSKGSGILYSNSNSARTVADCEFRYISQPGAGVNSATVYNYTSTSASFTGCLFESCLGGNTIRGEWNPKSGVSMTDCAFARILYLCTKNESDRGTGGVLGLRQTSYNDNFTRCFFTNNLTMAANSVGAPVFNVHWANFRKCKFAGNRLEVKPAAGRSYNLLGYNVSKNYGGRIRFDACVFKGNVVAAPELASSNPNDTCMLSIIGSGGTSYLYYLLDSQFADNAIESPADGMRVVKASTISSFNLATTAIATQITVVQCTFLGSPTADAYEIVQYGTEVGWPTHVVNSLFMNTHAAEARPLLAQCVAKTDVQSCTVQGLIAAPESPVYHGFRSETVRFEPVGDPLGFVRPAVRTPGVLGGLNVHTNSGDGAVYVKDGVNQIVTESRYNTLVKGGLMADAFGQRQPAGAFRRGAVQVFSPDAETNCALVVNCNPISGGTVDLAVQNVATGAVAAAITATPADNCSFLGWLDASGNLLSTSPTLSDYVVCTDTNLVASFSTPHVSLSFDLGTYGVFDAGGQQATISAPAGAVFPAIPAHTVGDEWYAYGWEPALPGTVPEESATYRLKAVTRELRIIHVVPVGEACGLADGSSWDNATDDFFAGYADAAIYRGEVWMKEGIYLFPEATASPILANVTVRGGFAGTETSADAADPDAHPSIFSGDMNGDDFWCPNGSDPGAASRITIFDGTTFNRPNPGATDRYWSPTGNLGDNRDSAFFANDSSFATNAAFVGVTFTGFKSATLEISSTTSRNDGELFRNCRFLGIAGGAVRCNGNAFSAIGCRFEGCQYAVYYRAPTGPTATFRDCEFIENSYGSRAASIHSDYYAGVVAIGCTFRGNTATAYAWRAASCVHFSTSGYNVFSNCLFEANRSYGGSYGTMACEGSPTVLIADCLFRGNLNVLPTSFEYAYETACLSRLSGNFLVRDSAFLDNAVVVPSSTSSWDGQPIFGSVAALAGATLQMLNCTLMGNHVTNNTPADATARHAGTIAIGSGSLGLAHCTIAESVIVGEKAHEIVTLCNSASANLAIVNSVINGSGAGYEGLTVVYPQTTVPSVANSTIAGFDPAQFTLTANDYFYNCTTTGGLLTRNDAIGPNGIPQRGISGSSPFAVAGRPVWLVGRTLYFHDQLADAAKPWRKIADKTSYAATVTGLSVENVPVADAFGTARKPRRIAYGPLNASVGNTVLLVR